MPWNDCAGDQDPEKRYAGEITDPTLDIPNNPYVSAMAAKTWLEIKAKAASGDHGHGVVMIADALG